MSVNDFSGNTVLAMHMDGANNSTTFTDEAGNVVTPHGSAKISTAQSKFGGASALFNGSTDYLSIPYSSNLAITNGENYTIDFWCYPTTTNYGGLIALSSYSTNTGYAQICIATNSSGKFNLLILQSGSYNWYSLDAPTYSGTSSYSPNNWYHVELDKIDTNYTLNIDGISKISYTGPSIPIQTMGQTLIGWSGYTGQYFAGYIDDVRLTKSLAKHTATFTPPAAAFTPDTFNHKASGLILPRHNPDINGLGTISGITEIQTGPNTYVIVSNCQVTLFNKKTNRPIAQTVSDANGVYTFANLNPLASYYTVSTDPLSDWDYVATRLLTVR